MQLSVSTLGTFYEMAREGAGLAAGRLGGMTGQPTRVGVTRLNFARAADVRSAVAGGGHRRGVSVELTGGFEGSTVMLFDDDSAATVVEHLMEGVSREGVEDIEASALSELCHVMNSGFVDGWADVLDTVIDVSPPAYVEGADAESLLSGVDTAWSDGDLALLFSSSVETVGAAVSFEHYLFPDRDTVAALLDRRGVDDPGGGIEYDKLVGFDRMAERGADQVAEDLSTMTGLETDVEVRRIDFVSLDAVPEAIPDEELVSVAFGFEGTPSGHLLFVFDLPSARALVAETVPGSDGEIDAMGRDALQEFGNVMASGFIDGWANVLETTIEHTPPEYTRDLGAAVIDPLVVALSREGEFAFVFDTVVRSAGGADVDVQVFAIPDGEDLETALSRLDLSMVEEAPTEAEFDVGAVDRDESMGGLEDVPEAEVED